MFGSRIARLFLLLVQTVSVSFAHGGGYLSGVVRDHSGAVTPGAEVRIVNESSGAQQKVTTDETGNFVSTELIPGSYRVILRRRGFRTAVYSAVRIQDGRTTVTNFFLELVPLQQEVTVESATDDSDPAASGLAVSRRSPVNALPSNGRDLHAYYALIPGATVTPASTSDGGQFTVNGQRPNTNTVRVDGVNGNTGLGISALPGTYPGSSLPGMSAIGSTQSMASKEEIQRTELRSSDFSAEFGERPGAQILIETRSGSSDFHGSAFGLLRSGLLNSQDWFAQKYQVPIAASSLNGYGASLSGALIPNRTFFFASLENEHVRDTAIQLMAVPSLAARSAASGGTALLLNAFPVPTGPQLGKGTALATIPFQQQASVQNYNARLDQMVGDKTRIFARYSNVPSHSETRQLDNIDASLRSITATVGVTGTWFGAVHDFRANFSSALVASLPSVSSATQQATFNAFANIPGIDAPDVTALYPFEATAFSVAGVGQFVSGTEEDSHQNQWNGVYTFSKSGRGHAVKWGGDYIRLVPSTGVGYSPTASALATGVEPLLAGAPLGMTFSGGRPIIYSGLITKGSAFGQDTFRLSDRLSILYGLRWEVTPPVGGASPVADIYSIGIWNGPGTTATGTSLFAALNTFTWPMKYLQFAPRFGLAYRLPSNALVFRAGGGMFYETAMGSILFPVNLSTLNSWGYVPDQGTIGSSPSSYGEITPPALSLPRIWEWRASLERSFTNRSTLSVAYSGSSGSRLLRLDGTADPSTRILQQSYFTSYGVSAYHALQAQFRGALTPNLQALVSYTWGHSIDNASQGSSIFLSQPGFPASMDRGSSDFDIRHNLNASLSFRLPSSLGGRRRNWLKDWTLSALVQARTGFPFDVTTVDRSIGLGFANTGRPDLVPGQPLWIQNGSVPGGRTLNPHAFDTPQTGWNGTLGRNVLTGPGLFQIDASLRRQFRLFGRASLETTVSVFNLLNHPSFANPISYLGSSLFGEAASMQNLMMGSGSPTNGLAPIFQSGGPRTVEFNLKLSF